MYKSSSRRIQRKANIPKRNIWRMRWHDEIRDDNHIVSSGIDKVIGAVLDTSNHEVTYQDSWLTIVEPRQS